MISSTEQEPFELLKYPYPYQAAFTVASDIDSANIARFRGVHALLCGRAVISKDSPDWHALGLTPNSAWFDKDSGGIRGLGLDFADSFFLIGDKTTFGMYRYLPERDGFEEDHQEGLNCANLVRQWLKEGMIDSYHTFLHYKRRQVEPLLKGLYEFCERETVAKPRVWINHSWQVTPSGLCPDRFQPGRAYRFGRLIARNVVGPFVGRKRRPLRYAFVRYHGDTPGSPYYINDLLAASGLRFVWLNRGGHHTDTLALPEEKQNNRSTILQPVTMDDGVRYYEFRRSCSRPPSSRDCNAYLRDSSEGFDASTDINEKSLEELYRCQGTCILYTHWTHFRSVPLADATIGRFDLLRRWQDAGKIWITSTARLLEWTRRRTFLKLACHREGKRLIVDLKGIEDPIFGREAIRLEDLDGLCLRLLRPEASLTVAINGQPLSSELFCRESDLCWLDARGTTPVKA
jgi:hypothetical protein